MVALLLKKLALQYKNQSNLLERLEELSKRPVLGKFKFFADEDNGNDSFYKGKIQIMTYHKSKGDEFDYVFIPQLCEEILPFDL